MQRIGFAVGTVAVLLILVFLLGWPLAVGITAFLLVSGTLIVELVQAERDGLGTAQAREAAARAATQPGYQAYPAPPDARRPHEAPHEAPHGPASHVAPVSASAGPPPTSFADEVPEPSGYK